MSAAAQDKPMFEIGAVVLGYVGQVASWRRPNMAYPHGDMKRYVNYAQVVIQVSSSADDGVHTPAESVSVSGREALLALRAAVDEALKQEGGAA